MEKSEQMNVLVNSTILSYIQGVIELKKITLLITALLFIQIISPTRTEAVTEPEPPSIHSEAAVVLEAHTGQVLYSKNKDVQMYPASLTKIATAIYAIEHGDLDETVTVSKRAYETGGSSVFLEEGDEATLRQLVEGLLLNSANDAGVAIAEHLSGSVEQFSDDLNTYLKEEVGVKNTHFQNPHGLFDPEHRTTAEDMAKITQYAQGNETFQQIYGMEVLEWDGQKWDATLYTHHLLMREDPYEGVIGGKTGFVPQSGFTLATSAVRGDTGLIVITMNSSSKDRSYEDTKKLLDYGFKHYETSMFKPEEEFHDLKKEYELPEKVPYTHLIGEKVEKNIENNRMVISYDDDTEIKSIKLKEVKKEESTEQSSDVEEASWKDYWPFFIFPRRLWVTELFGEIK
ncbi:D-alanyl-D-alanine carboxypeptidase family protein [Halobacillus karajensis]|uniref:D-alanyl-D-alanine carboxypeptidase DacB n=1 Tax=Halobacillus karajensis TaxID=195088 RepID=A0A024P998_9BACI|nr:D-alanyl-D-alanine carboxypeptidase family protein [Halobacillus karajensis]CDQ20934.1 D-alanyl-D-alanine carboxypeptidase DacB precursor [Halobacillus karajensis]CDQ25002.1 D-alanyl-D-alanine carboxypeptidase DacB precursor [Halobacillus karajensis]CDQ28637.1 D-alanyl-D-alanine carboxypeptidase DacB precursor [Halobacillus karajensis]